MGLSDALIILLFLITAFLRELIEIEFIEMLNLTMFFSMRFFALLSNTNRFSYRIGAPLNDVTFNW